MTPSRTEISLAQMVQLVIRRDPADHFEDGIGDGSIGSSGTETP
ncbi:hypothetical protein ACWC5I_09680 [Kitasatospora sp. NPDC001574]